MNFLVGDVCIVDSNKLWRIIIPYTTRHNLQCKPNDCFYVKYNARLKYNKATPFLFNNYLLKCTKHMLDVFSIENLSIHHKIRISLKDQFDLHKIV